MEALESYGSIVILLKLCQQRTNSAINDTWYFQGWIGLSLKDGWNISDIKISHRLDDKLYDKSLSILFVKIIQSM